METKSPPKILVATDFSEGSEVAIDRAIEMAKQSSAAVEILFDLEGLYLWWMTNLGPALQATEDVDDPRSEKITFLVHKNLESFQPLSGKEPY